MPLARDQLLRLLDEANAVLSNSQLSEMARSMDLPGSGHVAEMLMNASNEWEEIKERVANDA